MKNFSCAGKVLFLPFLHFENFVNKLKSLGKDIFSTLNTKHPDAKKEFVPEMYISRARLFD